MRIDWCSYKCSIECRRVIMNVLFPGIPPIWEGSKEGKVGDGDDDVKLIAWRPVFGWTDCKRICRYIKHLYDYRVRYYSYRHMYLPSLHFSV